MRLYNIKTQQIELLQPKTDRPLTLLVCALSPVSALNLNGVFTLCTADLLIRYLQMKGWSVQVGLQLTPETISQGVTVEQSYTQLTQTMQALNIRPPDQVFGGAEDIPQGLDVDLVFAYGQKEGAEQQTILSHFGWVSNVVAPEVVPSSSGLQRPKIVENVLTHWGADVLRLYLAHYHYRRPWQYDEVMLEKASQCIEKFNAALSAIGSGQRPINVTPALNRFNAAMENDLDTRKGIATLLNLADEILFRAANGYEVKKAQESMRKLTAVFGLQLQSDTLAHHLTTTNGQTYQRT